VRDRKLEAPLDVPSGTVTFLFSEIEGAAKLWETRRQAMGVAVARHEELLRSSVREHHGFVFKSLGNAFCVAFATADDAVAAALEAQRQLCAADFSDVGGLSVRMALHTGTAEERDHDYFGPAVNRVARLLSVGHGGQVLASGPVHHLVQAHLPEGATFVDLGSHRLRDLTNPEHVWQLSARGIPEQFPPLTSLDERPNNLPLQLTPLFGREQDLDEVKELLGSCRLVTVTGSGGVGKTRFALQLGADLIDRFPDGVRFADLAPITDPELVTSIVANALGMRQPGRSALSEALTEWLRPKQLLLIIDNCEHLLEKVAALVDGFQRNAPRVRILSTSRQPLGVAGEIAYRLPSLAIPEPGTSLRAADAMRYGALAVFVDRVAMTGTAFVLTDQNVGVVADICRHLDGIPFAIELAAARAKVLSVESIAERLSERFKILTGGNRSALPRQKTLSALIEWSYKLLTGEEQALFNRLGIFAGGFSLDAATNVCNGEKADDYDVLDWLSSLTDKSLIVADTNRPQTRYRLLESTRAYALERLEALHERERMARSHALYFRDQAQSARKGFGSGSTLAWLDEVQLELDNYRSALEWCLTQAHDPVTGGQIAGELGQFWFRGGLSAEGRYWIERALTMVSAADHPGVVARLLLSIGWLYSGTKTYESARQAAELFALAGDTAGVARARHTIAQGLFQSGRLEEASAENATALAELQACGDAWGVAACLDLAGAVAYNLGDVAAGRAFKLQSLAAFKAIGDELGSSIVAGNIAELEFADGNPKEAWRLLSDSLDANAGRRVDVVTLAIGHSNGMVYQIALGDLEGAERSGRKALELFRRSQLPVFTAWAIQHLALVIALRGDAPRAAQILGYVDACLAEHGRERETTEKWSHDKLVEALGQQLDAKTIAKLATEGATWSEDQAIEEALRA
jgi:predicted ATPase/class 3 adenylate cyclase